MNRSQEDEILRQAKEIEKRRSEEYAAQSRETMHRVETGQPPYTDTELIYAATARCKCGAGFAYPRAPFRSGMWVCAALLKSGDRSMQEQSKHDASLPFMFYEVKSEDQPSAYGWTTRPKSK
jgi:hypothetical protein